MLEPFDLNNKTLLQKVAHIRRRTVFVIFFERLTIYGWQFLTWLVFFAGLWLFEIPSLFGTAGRITAFFVFVIGAGFFIYRDLIRFRFPTRQEVDRRIEVQSQIAHRPLSTITDTLSNPEHSVTRTLWKDNREKALRLLQNLQPAKSYAFMAVHDPYALRLCALLFFMAGLFVSGSNWQERLYNGVTPFTGVWEKAANDKIVLWISPPKYTGIQPFLIKGQAGEKIIDIPEGSLLKISIQGGWSVPKLIAETGEVKAFQKLDHNYILETPVPGGTFLKVQQGFLARAEWNYHLINDTPPQISLAGEPQAMPEGSIRFPLEVFDDYGVKSVTMGITPSVDVERPVIGDPIEEIRTVMSAPNATMQIQPVYDLTMHPWAGLPVNITFSAEDQNNQKTTIPALKMTLPERKFYHPVAKQLIAIRKQLAWNPIEHYGDISDELEDILARPKTYLDDLTVFLALRSSSSRLYWSMNSPSKETATEVMALLWDTALRVEGGELSISARNLRDAQRNLENALQNENISNEDIQKLMGQLRGAMEQYFTELQREMQKRMAEGNPPPMIPPEMMAQMLDPEAMANFLDQLEEQMKSGDRKSAQDMLGQLQRLMDMMDPSMAAPMPPDMQMMTDGINKLQEMIKNQRDLMKRTGDQKNTMDEFINTQPHKEEQEKLRYDLGQIMQDAGEALDSVPENMGLAEQEMRGSSEALGRNDPVSSVPRQEQAIKHLQDSQKQLGQQLITRLQEMTGMALGGGNFDPLGRPYSGNGKNRSMMPGSPVKIPDEAERKKAQEILKLLRERSSDLGRPPEELEYYRRLLRQF